MTERDPRLFDAECFDELFDVRRVGIAEETPIGPMVNDEGYVSPADLTPVERSYWFIRSWQISTGHPQTGWLYAREAELTETSVQVAFLETVQLRRILAAIEREGG